MAKFPVHTAQTAPQGSANALAAFEKRLGFVPSLFGVFAENPAVLDAYTTLQGFVGRSGLSPLEREVVLMTSNVENQCHFCVAAHSTMDEKAGLDMDVIYAIRDGRRIKDPRLEALRQFTRKVVIDRGFVSDGDVQAFLASGWTKADVLAVILGVSLKVLSNYTNHVAETPVDDAFAKHVWTPPAERTDAIVA
ncbi:MAG: carboxymuconolactone decarboxylase family protein [Pseudomonadota bacterium]